MNSQIQPRFSALATSTPTTKSPVEEFCRNVMQLNNGAMQEIEKFMATLDLASRARFIERCSSMVSSVAESFASSENPDEAFQERR